MQVVYWDGLLKGLRLKELEKKACYGNQDVPYLSADLSNTPGVMKCQKAEGVKKSC